MEFRVDILNYGRYGCVAKEPRTGLSGAGDTEEEALADLRLELRNHMRHDYIPPDEGPVRSLRTIVIEGEGRVYPRQA